MGKLGLFNVLSMLKLNVNRNAEVKKMTELQMKLV